MTRRGTTVGLLRGAGALRQSVPPNMRRSCRLLGRARPVRLVAAVLHGRGAVTAASHGWCSSRFEVRAPYTILDGGASSVGVFRRTRAALRAPCLFHPIVRVKRLVPFLIGLLCLAAAGASLGAAQPADGPPWRGVVWEPPGDAAQAEADLRAMREAGIQAVRTPMLRSDRLLTLADTLGLQLFQELPLDYVPAGGLVDTLAYAQRLLALALDQAARHPSARHFGLARRSDTRSPAACAFFEALAEQARTEGPAGSRVYYLSLFPQTDACEEAVDFVLLDALNAETPAAVLDAWRAAHTTARAAPGTTARSDTTGGAARPAAPVGLGTLGLWVRPGVSGVRRAHTPEAQARYFETHLTHLLAVEPAPVAVFVHRWRDQATTRPVLSGDVDAPYVQRYGLWDREGPARPAFEVVAGLYTGRQTAFALEAGEAGWPEAPWTVLLGWGVLLLLAGCYAISPRFRYMVPRFFGAQGFYREALREGRDVVLWSATAMLVALALAAGVFGAILVEVLREQPAFTLVYAALPPDVQESGATLLARPWMLMLLLGSLHALAVAVWATLLAIAATRRYRLVPGQALMLALWPRWPLPLLMVAAMVVRTLPAEQAVPAALVLVGLALVGSLYAHLRTLIDYVAVTHVPGSVALGLNFASPFVLLLVFLLFGALELRDLLAFAWHLAVPA